MNDSAAIEFDPALYPSRSRQQRAGRARHRPGGPAAAEQVPAGPVDYPGTDAIRAAAERLGLGPASRVLEIGSGIGGPARFLAHTTGCQVTALEVQPKVHAIAADLTQRCGLSGRVLHVCGDALSQPLADAAFDAVVSWLAVLHIPDRRLLYARLARALRPGGACYIEDLCMRAPFAAPDLRDLREVVFGVSVTGIEAHVEDLRAAGFVDVVATDETANWAPYTAARLAVHGRRIVRATRARTARVPMPRRNCSTR